MRIPNYIDSNFAGNVFYIKYLMRVNYFYDLRSKIQ